LGTRNLGVCLCVCVRACRFCSHASSLRDTCCTTAARPNYDADANTSSSARPRRPPVRRLRLCSSTSGPAPSAQRTPSLVNGRCGQAHGQRVAASRTPPRLPHTLSLAVTVRSATGRRASRPYLRPTGVAPSPPLGRQPSRITAAQPAHQRSRVRRSNILGAPPCCQRTPASRLSCGRPRRRPTDGRRPRYTGAPRSWPISASLDVACAPSAQNTSRH